MNKQELIEKLKKEQQSIKWGISDGYNAFYNGIDTAYSIAIGLAKQLDEPKKVVFSHEEKFVADWLNDLRGQISNVKLNSGAVFMTFIGRQLERYYDEEYSFLTEKIESWLTVPKNKVKLMSAIDNGYEVEKEQLYEVVFMEADGERYLLAELGESYFEIIPESENDGYRSQWFTEQEIKSIDERYWPFAVKVDGGE